MDHSSVFQIVALRLRSMKGIQRRQVADIVAIVHFLLFFLFFFFFHPPSSSPTLNSSPPHPHLHTLAHPLLIVVHQKQHSIALLTPTCTQDQLPFCHLPCTSVNENLNQLLHSIKGSLCTILNPLKMLFLSMLNVMNHLCNHNHKVSTEGQCSC